jgi:hypothetical protein
VYWVINAILFVPNRLFIIMYICLSIANDVVLTCVLCDNAQLVTQKVRYW